MLASATHRRLSAAMSEHAPRRRPRFQEFQDLMRFRILDILLVATPYDAFVLEEAGELSERMLGEFRNLDLHYAPGLTAVATGAERRTARAGDSGAAQTTPWSSIASATLRKPAMLAPLT